MTEAQELLENRFSFYGEKHQLPPDIDWDGNLLLKWAATKPFTEICVEKGQEEPRGGWYSDGYGQIEPAPALSASLQTQLPWRAATLLFPYRGKDIPAVKFEFADRIARIQHPDLGEVIIQCSLP